VKLYIGSYFAFYVPKRQSWVEFELPAPTRLADILSELGIPTAEIHLVVVNDQVMESPDTLITNQDIVRLYPAVGGG
jgi:sulfur carrier protein ThiS